MSSTNENDLQNGLDSEPYEPPAVTEIGDAGKVILGPDKVMADVDNSTYLP